MCKLRTIGGILRSSLILESLKPYQNHHSGTVIFLHGIGERGQSWKEIFETIQNNGNQHLKFICPNSFVQPVSKYKRFPIRSWFNFSKIGDENINDMNYSRETIQTIIKNEMEQFKIPSERIVLGGFGQGGALALYTFYSQNNITNKNSDPENNKKYMLSNEGVPVLQKDFINLHFEHDTDGMNLNGGYSFGGCFTISGYIPITEYFQRKMLSSLNIDKPLLMFHGDKDQIIDISIGEQSFKFLNNQGIKDSEFIIYKEVGDGVCNNEILDISNFLNKVLPDQKK